MYNIMNVGSCMRCSCGSVTECRHKSCLELTEHPDSSCARIMFVLWKWNISSCTVEWGWRGEVSQMIS